VLIFFHYIGWTTWFEKQIIAVFAPFPTIANSWRVKLDDKYRLYKERDSLSKLYEQCLIENKKIIVQKTELEILKEENSELKKIVNFKTKSNYFFITSKIIGKSANNLEKIVIIDLGKNDGLKMGQAVVVDQGILAGKIVRVGNNTSMVRLTNDNQSKVAATILNKERSSGVVEGGYGLSMRMNFIPRNEVILVGDKVITSGLESGIPRGLLIGEIAVAENESYKPFQQAVLTPSTDLSKIIIASVLIQNLITTTPEVFR